MARKHGRRWITSVTDSDGVRHRPTFPTKAEAEAWEEEARAAIQDGKPLPEPRTGKGAGRQGARSLALLGDLFDHVCRTEWDHLRSAETATKNGEDVVAHFGRKCPVDEIGSQEVADFCATMAGRGLAPATVNRKRGALMRMLRIAYDTGVIDRVPVHRPLREDLTRFRYLDRDEEALMLAYWRAEGMEDMRDLCILLIDTGARCYSEMLPVRWDAFNSDFASVTFWETKTNNPRSVPLTSRCRDILRRRWKALKEHAGPFMGHPRGRHAIYEDPIGERKFRGITKNNMRHRWDAMRMTTGLEDVTPHTLRHTCCTRLILGGADVKRVMTWMGHTSITTTMRYMQIRPKALEDVLHLLEEAS